MAFLGGNQHDSAPSGLDGIAADDLIGGPIGALHQDVGLHQADDVGGRVFVEDHHGIDAVERGENLRSFLFRRDWPA